MKIYGMKHYYNYDEEIRAKKPLSLTKRSLISHALDEPIHYLTLELGNVPIGNGFSFVRV